MSLSFYTVRTSKWKVPVTASNLGPATEKKAPVPEAAPLVLHQGTVADLGHQHQHQQQQRVLADDCGDDEGALDAAENFQAFQAQELLRSIRRRHLQLGRFLQQFNEFKMNPLCGAMCADLEDKIHQMALLIRSQQRQLKHMVDAYDQQLVRSASALSRSSSTLEEWEEEMHARSASPQPLENLDAPVTNWMATIRVTVLKEVIDFSTNDLKRIETSPLLAVRPTQLLRRPPSLSGRSFSSSSASSASSFSAFM